MAFVSNDLVSGTGNWYSTVGYLKYDHSDKIKLTYRAEYFDDKDGVVVLIDVDQVRFICLTCT